MEIINSVSPSMVNFSFLILMPSQNLLIQYLYVVNLFVVILTSIFVYFNLVWCVTLVVPFSKNSYGGVVCVSSTCALGDQEIQRQGHSAFLIIMRFTTTSVHTTAPFKQPSLLFNQSLSLSRYVAHSFLIIIIKIVSINRM